MPLETYLAWLDDKWQVDIDSSNAEERPAADGDNFRTFSPLGGEIVDHGTEMMLHTINRRPGMVRDRAIWEVGCGNGDVAVTCSLLAPRSVCATDIDPAAVEATRMLAERNRASVKVGQASIMENAPCDTPPDLIIANLPQKPAASGSDLPPKHNGGPDGTSLLRPFFDQAQDRLAPNGEILLLVLSLPHPSALRLLQAHFETELVSWRRRIFTPNEYWRKLREEGSCWFEEDAFCVLQILARRRSV